MYFHRSTRHFIVFSGFLVICILRSSFFVRLLQGAFLFPLQKDDIILLACAIFLLCFLYVTGVGYAFTSSGILKKYPLIKPTLYKKEDIVGYEFVDRTVSIWIIHLKDNKDRSQKLILPSYFPKIAPAVEKFLIDNRVKKLN